MKAIIIDYTDGTLSILPIPKEWEDNAEEFVVEHPFYDDSTCHYMISKGDISVYDIVNDGDAEDGTPFCEYRYRLDL